MKNAVALLWVLQVVVGIVFDQPIVALIGAVLIGILSKSKPLMVLSACVVLLSTINIDTSTMFPQLLPMALVFAAVVGLPPLALKLLQPNQPSLFRWQFWPTHLSKLELAYILLSAPLAWGAFELYFKLSPHVPYHWVLPAQPDGIATSKLFWGINAVGIWDELFFINTSFVLLRSYFSFWKANLAQAVLYVSVLYDLAFTHWGIAFVAFLALTQGLMFERSKAVVYVIVVHIIVDVFLFRAITHAYYGTAMHWPF